MFDSFSSSICGCVLVLCFYDYAFIVVQAVLSLSVLDLSYCVSLCADILA